MLKTLSVQVLGFTFSFFVIWICFGFRISSFGFPSLSNAAEPEDNPLDPRQIRRLLISPERVPEILARAKKGILVRLPRQEFEEKVQRALQSMEAAKNPPRLLEARYRATLMNNALVGTAEWKMTNPAPGAGVLPLEPFNLALLKATVRKAQFDATEAILGDWDGKTLGLLLQPGEQAASLHWSARGEPGPGGLHFDLQIPACPVASLELDLPANLMVVPGGRDAYFLTGPFATSPHAPPPMGEGSGRRRSYWRIEFAGHSRVDLMIRDRNDNETPRVRVATRGLAQVQTTYDLSPGFVQADFEFKLEMPPHHRRQPLEFEFDPPLQPVGVSVSNLDAWESASPSKLVVRLKEPFQGGSILIHCLAQLGPDHSWNCPGVRLLTAIPRGETIVFRIPGDMQLENWQPGDFRLIGNDVQADGRQLLTLVAANPNESGSPRRPIAQINVSGPKYRVKQLAWWQIGPKGSVLTAQFLYAVGTGQLFQLPLHLPSGWEVDKVELVPAGLLRNWTVTEEQGQRTLLVVLQRPLTSSTVIPLDPTTHLLPRLSVWLRPPAEPAPLVDMPMTFPDVVPRGAEFREGLLAISVDPIFQARVKASIEETTPAEKGPWGRQSPDFSFAFQGKPLIGTLTLHPRRPRIRARCDSDVVVSPKHVAVAIRLAVQCDVSGPNSLILSLSSPVPQLENWKTKGGSNRLRQVRRLAEAGVTAQLAALGAPTILDGLNYLSINPVAGQLWLLTFDRPLSEEEVILETNLDLAATVPPDRRDDKTAPLPAEQLLDVPIPSVIGADSMEGELTLQRVGAELRHIEAAGLIESSSDAGGSPTRKFRYGPASGTLKFRIQAAKMPTEPILDSAQADRVCLKTYLESQGKLVNYFSFRMVNWPQQTLPIRLPPGARPFGATVNGSWIPHLRWAETEDGAICLELPATAGKVFQHYQIVYGTTGAGWNLGARVKAPLPELPVRRILDLRRSWCLPPGAAPLDGGALRPLPGPSEFIKAWDHTAFASIPFQAMQLSWREKDEWADKQRQAMIEAGNRLRRQLENNGPIELGEGLERLAFEFLKDRMQLVLDVRAFREAHLTPRGGAFTELEATDDSFPWERLGLVYVPCGAAPLLTSRSQWEAWQTAGQQTTLSGTLAAAVAEAATHGHDRSGRFQTVAEWLQQDLTGVASSDSQTDSLDHGIDAGWTEWEQLVGSDGNKGPIVIQRDLLVRLSFFFSLLFVLAAWQTRKSKAWIRWLFFFIWVAGGTLAGIWLPSPLHILAQWPTLIGWAISLLLFLRWLASPVGMRIKLGSAAAMGGVVFGLFGLPGHAVAPGPVIVYIVPGPSDAPTQQTVLAPPEVLEKLRELADGILSSRRGPMLLSARYDGIASDNTVDFKADFQVHSFSDQPFPFTISLSDISLRDALLDGGPANATAIAAGPGQNRKGISVLIQGKGTHAIRFRFAVPFQGGADFRDLQFRIPELPMSRLSLQIPPGSSLPYAVAAKGRQRIVPVTAEASSGKKILRLEADLGQIGSLDVRWRNEEPKPGVARVREVYLWNIQPYDSTLLAFLQYTASQGALTNLVLDLPEQMELRSDPVVARDPADNSKDSPPRLKDWYWQGTGQQRRLVLEFLRPWTGTLQVTLELIPRTPFRTNAELPLPTPQGIQPQAEKGLEHFLAYRVQGLEAQLAANLRITGIDQDAFRSLWASSGLADPGPEIHAFSFRREPAGSPLLRLKLTPLSTSATGVLNVTWRLRKNQAELTATAKLNSTFPELGLVEWEVPPALDIITIGGPQVRSWSRTGSRIQVWLKDFVTEATLQLTGFLALPRGQSSFAFQVLPLRVAPAQTLATFVWIEGDREALLESAKLRNLLPLPRSDVSERELSYVTDQADYGGEVNYRASPLTSMIRVLTFLETIDRQVHFRSTINLSTPPGGKRKFTVSLRNWQGEAQIEGPGNPRVATSELQGERRWSVDLPAGVTSLLHLKGEAVPPPFPPPTGGGGHGWGVSLPDVKVEGETQQRWLALTSGLRAQNAQGLLALTDPNWLSQWWPEQKDQWRRASSVWEIRDPNWKLELGPGPAVAESAFRVLLADQEAAIVHDKNWEYQSTYWLCGESESDLTVQFPTAAKIISVTVDGMEVSPRPLSSTRWWVPLAGRRASRILHFRWIYEAEAAPLERPILENPRLERLPDFPAIWTVHVPPGFLLEGRQAPAQEITSGAKFLHAAEAQLQLSSFLAKLGFDNDRRGVASLLQAAQERFYRYCGFAQHWLALTNASDAVLQELRQRNRKQANAQGFEKTRQRAEEQARLDPLGLDGVKENGNFPLIGSLLTEQGTPTYWLVTPGSTAPRLHLTTYWQRRIKDATRATGFVVVFLLTMVVIGCMPRGRNLVRAIGPELMMLLGALGWWLTAPDLSLVLLIILGLVARLSWLIGKWATWEPSLRKESESAIRRTDRSTPPSLAGSS